MHEGGLTKFSFLEESSRNKKYNLQAANVNALANRRNQQMMQLIFTVISAPGNKTYQKHYYST